MNNPKWGTKRQCQECGARFYDLKRTKVVCPKCDAPFKPDPPPKPKRAIATPPKTDAAPPAEEKPKTTNTALEGAEESAEDKALKEFDVSMPAETSPDADDDDDEDENTFEDASELGEDKDDMAEVIDGSRKVGDS